MRQLIRMLMNILVARVILNAREAIRRHNRAFGEEFESAVNDVSFSEPISANSASGGDWTPETLVLSPRSQASSSADRSLSTSEDKTLREDIV